VLLLIRFLRAVIMGLLAPSRGIFDESVLTFRVLPQDIDLNFHLNDGRYISFTGLGRAHLLTRMGLLRKALRKKWAPVVAGAMIRYKREIRPFAKFTLRSRVIGWDEKWVYLAHVIESGGKPCATAYVRGVLRSRDGAVPTKDLLALIGFDGASPELPEVVKNWPEIDV
jgi:acyl-CoA thioesterase FadM